MFLVHVSAITSCSPSSYLVHVNRSLSQALRNKLAAKACRPVSPPNRAMEPAALASEGPKNGRPCTNSTLERRNAKTNLLTLTTKGHDSRTICSRIGKYGRAHCHVQRRVPTFLRLTSTRSRTRSRNQPASPGQRLLSHDQSLYEATLRLTPQQTHAADGPFNGGS